MQCFYIFCSVSFFLHHPSTLHYFLSPPQPLPHTPPHSSSDTIRRLIQSYRHFEWNSWKQVRICRLSKFTNSLKQIRHFCSASPASTSLASSTLELLDGGSSDLNTLVGRMLISSSVRPSTGLLPSSDRIDV